MLTLHWRNVMVIDKYIESNVINVFELIRIFLHRLQGTRAALCLVDVNFNELQYRDLSTSNVAAHLPSDAKSKMFSFKML